MNNIMSGITVGLLILVCMSALANEHANQQREADMAELRAFQAH